jgi:protein O-mannosyl-transferase
LEEAVLFLSTVKSLQSYLNYSKSNNKMGKEKIEWQSCINWRILIVFSLLIFISYSNSFKAPFHFDDFGNITENSRLHIDNLDPQSILDVVFGGTKGNKIFYRPVSNLSIAVNWYFGQSNVTGYHIFNISVHILTAFFLYLTIVTLLKTPKFYQQYDKNKYFISILAACFWALNPIQTQAVTYIVQRMAAMAALFYILGIFCYLKARLCNSMMNCIFWSLGLVASFLLAVGSKENAIMFPMALLLIEMVFFQNMANPEIRKKLIVMGSVILLVVFVLGVWLFLSSGFIGNILNGYERRTFTLSERLLTQPRIVVFYLSQIFYPIADRLSLDHDIVISNGLFSPWTTLPAIFLIIGLIGFSIWKINKYPLLAFAILFFFLNHIIESSIISLELIFEHRNYLPSLFLFLPIAAGIKKAIDYYSYENHSNFMRGLLVCFSVALIVMFGLGTYVRNMAWADEKTLWEDTIEKAPGRARAYQNLGKYYEKRKEFDRILELSEKSMYLADSTRNKAELISLSNMAAVYANKKNYNKAIELYNQILSNHPEKHDVRYRLVLAKIRAGQKDDLSNHIDNLISEKPDSHIYLNLKALILLNQNDPEKAWNYLKQAVSIAPDDKRTLLNLGTARMLMGEYVLAERYLKRVPGPFNRNMTALFLLIENSIRSGNTQKAVTYADHLLSGFTIDQILESLDKDNQTNLQWPFSIELIVPVISERLENRSGKIQNLGNFDGA